MGYLALTWKPADPLSAMVAQGRELYGQHCAACHGVTLEGQPEWRSPLANGRMPAPPHDETGHTWHHSDQDLFTIVKGGLGAIVPGYESDMPAFGEVLTDQQIRSVIEFIKSTWPRREREVQGGRTAADR
ncbi:MAG: cytochrome c [Alphaproteobacteria bacterium]